MPKDTRRKFYAVLNGRGGPRIYDSFREYRAALKGYSGSSGKGFFTYEDALKWLISVVPNLDLTIVQQSTSVQIYNSAATASGPSAVDSASRAPTKQYANASVQCSLSTPNSSPNQVLPLLNPTPPTRALRYRYIPPGRASSSRPTLPPRNAVDPPANAQEPPRPEIALSQEQKDVLEMALSGRNIFFTGPAGTGKSVLLREIISRLRVRRGHDRVAVTAPTGVAGINIGGSTIHSWAGIGLGKPDADILARRIEGSDKLSKRWLSTAVLIIDEISMLDGRLFDKLEKIGRRVRGTPLPFGGIQLILSGDFYQLPPVPDESHKHVMPSTFAFDAASWSVCVAQPVLLTQVFRQRDDRFIQLLGAIRRGCIGQEQVDQIKDLQRKVVYDDGIEPTELFPLRAEVDCCNNARLIALQGEATVYEAMDAAGWDVDKRQIPKEVAAELLKKLVAPPKIALKINAQVMLLVNLQQGAFVNGSVGKVVDFITTKEAMQRKIEIAELKQYESPPPLDPITKHEFLRDEKWPLVKFEHGEVLCVALPFQVQGWKGNVEAVRTQVPLALAWAMSIHKAQGQTLTRVKVDLTKVFEKGQAYVALSRATTLEHLEVVDFDPGTIQAHERVQAWQGYWEDYKAKEARNAREMQEMQMDCDEAVSRYWENDQAPYIP
ncbi:hypothetical protein AX16_002573 [Volvariella volvacea WC 439]|nr:hypothetical protein AX16_002573 [Volvariella volvacea WC 439]